MSALKSHFIEAAGQRVHVLEAGQGPAVLFVHGWPMHGALWRHSVQALATHRRAIAIDLPGFGASDKRPDADYTLEAHARVIDATLDALGIDTLGLCVHDAGGPIGLWWAVHRPERVTRLCLLNTLVFPELSWAVKAVLASGRLPGAAALLGSSAALKLTLRSGLRRAPLTAQLAQRYLAPFAHPDAGAAFRRSILHMDLSKLAHIASRLELFSAIPVRLIYGARDLILPDVAKTMRRVREVLPHAELFALPELGHFLQEDDPERVAALVAGAFLDDPAP